MSTVVSELHVVHNAGIASFKVGCICSSTIALQCVLLRFMTMLHRAQDRAGAGAVENMINLLVEMIDGRTTCFCKRSLSALQQHPSPKLILSALHREYRILGMSPPTKYAIGFVC